MGGTGPSSQLKVHGSRQGWDGTGYGEGMQAAAGTWAASHGHRAGRAAMAEVRVSDTEHACTRDPARRSPPPPFSPNHAHALGGGAGGSGSGSRAVWCQRALAGWPGWPCERACATGANNKTRRDGKLGTRNCSKAPSAWVAVAAGAGWVERAGDAGVLVAGQLSSEQGVALAFCPAGPRGPGGSGGLRGALGGRRSEVEGVVVRLRTGTSVPAAGYCTRCVTSSSHARSPPKRYR